MIIYQVECFINLRVSEFQQALLLTHFKQGLAIHAQILKYSTSISRNIHINSTHQCDPLIHKQFLKQDSISIEIVTSFKKAQWKRLHTRIDLVSSSRDLLTDKDNFDDISQNDTPIDVKNSSKLRKPIIESFENHASQNCKDNEQYGILVDQESSIRAKDSRSMNESQQVLRKQDSFNSFNHLKTKVQEENEESSRNINNMQYDSSKIIESQSSIKNKKGSIRIGTQGDEKLKDQYTLPPIVNEKNKRMAQESFHEVDESLDLRLTKRISAKRKLRKISKGSKDQVISSGSSQDLPLTALNTTLVKQKTRNEDKSLDKIDNNKSNQSSFQPPDSAKMNEEILKKVDFYNERLMDDQRHQVSENEEHAQRL
ncbi:UNKNOWN [Stylonychia lemnae]|uniref:Uncharacterized protein n=1 Tax=Stylonychia lemnae TaxID=5949 RepID=A0A078AWZ8_STYLE|nr:UNKNOWN [Stylonychia lemnae]|eukprot:CDW86586.1 UNKNOWN [Stylonychia lemnae]